MNISTVKSFFKNTKAQLVILVGVIVLGAMIIDRQKSNIKYLHELCPRCNSYEVLDFGYDERLDGVHGHCPDCGYDFYVHCSDCNVTFTNSSKINL